MNHFCNHAILVVEKHFTHNCEDDGGMLENEQNQKV